MALDIARLDTFRHNAQWLWTLDIAHFRGGCSVIFVLYLYYIFTACLRYLYGVVPYLGTLFPYLGTLFSVSRYFIFHFAQYSCMCVNERN